MTGIFPSLSTQKIQDDRKKYEPCNASTELMLGDSLDLTPDIYEGLLNTFRKPQGISSARFNKILLIKAKIFNHFVGEKLIIDRIFNELEKACSVNFLSTSISKNTLLKKNLCPKFYKRVQSKLSVGEDDEIYEEYFFPIISKEILSVIYPTEILAQALKQQLQKHNINIPDRKNIRKFLKTDGWLAFFGIVPVESAIQVLKKGNIFIDPLDFPDTDSRSHGPFSHAIQEYLNSKLLEEGYLGDLHVDNEEDITEFELVQAEAWPIRQKNVLGVSCLFDIMRERRPNKLKLLNVYPDEFYGFTSPDFVNQYLMLNPFRFPCLSSLIYNQYAHATLAYFRLDSAFKQLVEDEQLELMNYYIRHTSQSSLIKNIPDIYTNYESSDAYAIKLKKYQQPLLQFSYTLDDSSSYIRARQKVKHGFFENKKFAVEDTLLSDLLVCNNNN